MCLQLMNLFNIVFVCVYTCIFENSGWHLIVQMEASVNLEWLHFCHIKLSSKLFNVKLFRGVRNWRIHKQNYKGCTKLPVYFSKISYHSHLLFYNIETVYTYTRIQRLLMLLQSAIYNFWMSKMYILCLFYNEMGGR